MPLRTLADIQAHVHKQQACLARLTYSQAHPPSFDKQRVGAQGMHKMDQMGRDVLQRNQPIQCLEAVMVAAHLTLKLPIHRLPVSFTTRVRETGHTHKHIVLALVCESHQRWGAMGMSRCPDLMDKELVYESLTALVEEYQRAYSGNGHEVESAYVGLPFSSSSSCTLPVVWRALHIQTDLKAHENDREITTLSSWKVVLEKYGQSIEVLLAYHRRHPRSTPSSASLYAWLEEDKAPLRLRDLLLMQQGQEGEEGSQGGKGRSRREKKRAWLVPSPSGA